MAVDPLSRHIDPVVPASNQKFLYARLPHSKFDVIDAGHLRMGGRSGCVRLADHHLVEVRSPVVKP